MIQKHATGTGWADTAGTEGMTTIPVSKNGQILSYKKVRFPELKLHKITTKDNNAYIQLLTSNDKAYAGDPVTVRAWTQGSYSPKVYLKKTSDGSLIYEIEMTPSGKGFRGSFTMPDCDVTVAGEAGGSGDGDDTDVSPDTATAVGSVHNVEDSAYVVTAADTVSLVKAPNGKSSTIPAAVEIGGKKVRVK